MAVTAVAPEYILGDAVIEFILASRSVKQMQELGFKDWTLVHGFYGNMGGFAIDIAEGGRRALTNAELKWLVETGHVHPFTICRQEIEDRSKADPLLKFFTCLQVSWFLLQCIVRVAKRMDITPLEVTTAGFVMCSIIVFFFWMNKPLDVKTCHVISGQKISKADIIMLETHVRPIRETTEHVDNSYLAGREDSAFNGLMGWSYDLWTTCILGCVLGAIHTAGWNLRFTTTAEQILWRTTSLVTTVTPAIMPCVSVATKTLEQLHFRWASTSTKFEKIWTWNLIALYVVARGYLLIACLVALRSSPASVYECIDWTNVIPHV
ncbi:uncharacterized protein KY384_008427 [Bacidia gigantensis]|uniref:uncharacterized protein n=1 Tax=Bacidia gigantensis TaxID=2732470 RepID=UPI001D0584BB|nr:uncharacterized protein KY384_008427 [Bacidia gigantensis]KAG8526998.1 hypothetical protein KY384_008427 [Bacidia gigantensis]